jgi:hypothetical protein
VGHVARTRERRVQGFGGETLRERARQLQIFYPFWHVNNLQCDTKVTSDENRPTPPTFSEPEINQSRTSRHVVRIRVNDWIIVAKRSTEAVRRTATRAATLFISFYTD